MELIESNWTEPWTPFIGWLPPQPHFVNLVLLLLKWPDPIKFKKTLAPPPIWAKTLAKPRLSSLLSSSSRRSRTWKMTLGERQGDEKNDSKYCGVETEFNDDMPQLLSFNIHGGFDFVVAPLVSNRRKFSSFLLYQELIDPFVLASVVSNPLS